MIVRVYFKFQDFQGFVDKLYLKTVLDLQKNGKGSAGSFHTPRNPLPFIEVLFEYDIFVTMNEPNIGTLLLFKVPNHSYILSFT